MLQHMSLVATYKLCLKCWIKGVALSIAACLDVGVIGVGGEPSYLFT